MTSTIAGSDEMRVTRDGRMITITLDRPDDQNVLGEATALAARIAASGPLAIRGAKRIMNMRARSGFAAARRLSDTLRHALEWSRDVDEGMAAHREGRPPRFTGC